MGKVNQLWQDEVNQIANDYFHGKIDRDTAKSRYQGLINEEFPGEIDDMLDNIEEDRRPKAHHTLAQAHCRDSQ